MDPMDASAMKSERRCRRGISERQAKMRKLNLAFFANQVRYNWIALQIPVLRTKQSRLCSPMKMIRPNDNVSVCRTPGSGLPSARPPRKCARTGRLAVHAWLYFGKVGIEFIHSTVRTEGSPETGLKSTAFEGLLSVRRLYFWTRAGLPGHDISLIHHMLPEPL